MNSMTGFGRATANSQTIELTIEIHSVNKRNAEFSCSLPKEWSSSLGLKIQDMLRPHVHRGKVTVTVEAKKSTPETGLTWDSSAIKTSLKRLHQLADEVGVPFKLSSDILVKIVKLEMSLETDEALNNWEVHAPALNECLEKALVAFNQMRKNEGDNLIRDLNQRIKALKQTTQRIKDASKHTASNYKALLMERLKKADLELDLDDERLLKEISIFADRCDISEEVTRLESHLEQFLCCLSKEEPMGRKLDFICQEIHREFNTIGSKANHLSITNHVIEAKNELERIREQAQNIE